MLYRQKNKMKTVIQIIVAGAGTLLLLSAGFIQTTAWVAPKEADAMKNPLMNNADATAKGKILYTQFCAICHGDKGKGDGVGGMNLTPKPTNYTSYNVQSQTDGAIYWKITNGNPPMPSYKDILKDEQRWQLINYIRTLAQPVNSTKKK